MTRLPVSAAVVDYLAPTGEDDLAFVGGPGGWAGAAALASRRVVGSDGGAIDEITAFVDRALVPAFGLPSEIS